METLENSRIVVDNGKFFDLGGKTKTEARVEHKENNEKIHEIEKGNSGEDSEVIEKKINFSEKPGEFNWPIEELKETLNEELENSFKDHQAVSNETKENIYESQEVIQKNPEKKLLNDLNTSENLGQFGLDLENEIKPTQTIPNSSELLITSTNPDREKY